MKRALLVFSLLFSISAWCSTGDITAVRISSDATSNGWAALVDIETGGVMSTGGIYSLGMGARNNPSNAKVVFTVTSQGFDSSGDATTVIRTVYGQYQLRKAYPDQAVMDEAVSGGTLTVKLVLSDPIYASDTVSMSAAAGWYSSNSAATQAVSGLAVTNSSTLSYQAPICGNTTLGRTIVTSSVTPSVFCIAGSAANGNPVQAVVFTATDAHSHSVSATVNTLTRTAGMAVDFDHYSTTLDISSLTDGDLITVSYKAYPRLGTASQVYDSTAAGKSVVWLKDAAGTFGRSYAYVDPASGNDTTCAASNVAATAKTTPCLTIGRAERIVRDYNYSYFSSRSNLANSIIYLMAGTYSAAGTANLTYSATNDSVLWTLTRDPDTPRSSVVIQTNADSLSRNLKGKYVRVSDVTLRRDANRYLFDEPDASWILFENCTITDNTSYTTPIVSTANGVYFFRNDVSTYAKLMNTGAIGNTLTNVATMGYARLAIGNLVNTGGYTSTLGAIFSESTACTSGNSTADGGIIYSNKLINSREMVMDLATHCNISSGLAVVQNLIESLYVTGGGYAVGISADGSTTTANNVIFAHNTLVGNRANLAYNDSGTTFTPQINWVIRNNNLEYFANKGDTFTKQSTTTGNWPVAFGVASSGNAVHRGAYLQEFQGLWSVTGTNESLLAMNYKNDLSATTGFGDYHATVASPFRSLVPASTQMLPRDLDGKPRAASGMGSAGSFEFFQRGGNTLMFSIP
jgi:hypothetical protein